ncbi:hypothetical protein CH373_02785 [Leptospira perolatii]|uniref:Diphthamide synthase domain-containing protein n=2 Tax=Leptospira perolatii TaxID=2023191 RepID=A0A2M9ZT28_9LEPT|nr:hypothetical protein CH360_02785 [Leptospira perolatii]PJZ75216.1 hypothetical protein CH373_02785 [Leptospira perolatii]
MEWAISWSSGKDSAFAFWVAEKMYGKKPKFLLTSINQERSRVSMHGVREELLDLQGDRAGVPLLKVRLPEPCPMEVYEAEMDIACAQLKESGVEILVFGDLFLQDIRDYREKKLANSGIRPVFPIWGRDTKQLALDMIANGFKAKISTLNPKILSPDLVGLDFDLDFLQKLPATVDPCGENGEFHTIVYDAPFFSRPIPIRLGEIVERSGFTYADLLTAS